MSRYASLAFSIIMLVLFLPLWLVGVLAFVADIAGGTFNIEALMLFVVTLPVVGLPSLYAASFIFDGRFARFFSDHRNAQD